MIVIPFIPEHLRHINLIDEMFSIKPYIDNGIYADLIDPALSYTVTVDGDVIACGGMVRQDMCKHIAWALMGKETRQYMAGITKEVLKFLDEHNVQRIEAHIKHSFDSGHRWIKMLGFECETPHGMRNWGVDNETYYLYSRCR